jgi:hypothetical protein
LLTALSALLRKYTNGWLALILLVGVIFFNTVVFSNQQSNLAADSGGARPLDLLYAYTPQTAYALIASYGEAGRAEYRRFELTIDLIYPIVYTLFFSLAATWLFQRGFSSDSAMQTYNIIPLGAWLFDLFENLGIAAMLSIHPLTPAWLAWAAAAATSLKWLFVFASGLLLLIGFAAALKNGFKAQT